MKVILKEFRETTIFLTLISRKSFMADASLLKESNKLIAIFSKGISTTQVGIKTRSDAG